jgi:O-antigen ligase
MFLSVLLISTWVGVILFPGEALLPSRGTISYTIKGVAPSLNGNTVAFYAAVVALDAICAVLEKQPSRLPLLLRWGWILAVLITLVVAQSRTSLVGLILALLTYLFITKRLALLFFLVLISAVGLFGLGAYQGFESYFMRGQSTELFTSLSGRAGGWELAWEMFKQSPWVGHGFAAAARLNILGVGGASTLHGSIFDVIVGVGLIGLIPWSIALLYGFTSSMRSPFVVVLDESQRAMAARLFCVVVLIFVRSSTSSGLAMYEHTLTLALICFAYANILKSTH